MSTAPTVDSAPHSMLDSVSALAPAHAPAHSLSITAMAATPSSIPTLATEDSSDSSSDLRPTTLVEKEPINTWASLVGKNNPTLFEGTAAEHVSQVRPIFLAYKRVSWEGHRIPIAEVASAVTQAVDGADQIDGIQAMKAGWNIYMKTDVDCAQLLVAGINIVGCHVSLSTSR